MKNKTLNYHHISSFAYLALMTVVLYSCEGNVKSKSTPYVLDGGVNVRIVVIDSCEYIKTDGGNATWGSHKGNCKFCAERNKK